MCNPLISVSPLSIKPFLYLSLFPAVLAILFPGIFFVRGEINRTNRKYSSKDNITVFLSQKQCLELPFLNGVRMGFVKEYQQDTLRRSSLSVLKVLPSEILGGLIWCQPNSSHLRLQSRMFFLKSRESLLFKLQTKTM